MTVTNERTALEKVAAHIRADVKAYGGYWADEGYMYVLGPHEIIDTNINEVLRFHVKSWDENEDENTGTWGTMSVILSRAGEKAAADGSFGAYGVDSGDYEWVADGTWEPDGAVKSKGVRE